MTRDQLLEKTWRELSPELQAHCQQVMAATGKTWDQLCRDLQEGFLEHSAEAMGDPECPFARYLVYRQFPYGQDPLLNKGV